MELNEYTAPESWACYLINGDASGYDPEEMEAILAFERELAGPVVSCTGPEDSDHPGFLRWHDAADVYPYAADCALYVAYGS